MLLRGRSTETPHDDATTRIACMTPSNHQSWRSMTDVAPRSLNRDAPRSRHYKHISLHDAQQSSAMRSSWQALFLEVAPRRDAYQRYHYKQILCTAPCNHLPRWISWQTLHPCRTPLRWKPNVGHHVIHWTSHVQELLQHNSYQVANRFGLRPIS